MTYSDWVSQATPDERMDLRQRIEAIIGTKEQAKMGANSLSERINRGNQWEAQYEKLVLVFANHGAKALALNYMQEGRSFKGVTPQGKHWILYANHGWTARSRYCGTLYIEEIGTVFTSGKLDKAFEYILNN